MTPIPTEWDITHPCGHTARCDFSDKPAGQRAGAARWVAKHRNCPDCERASRAEEARALTAEARRDGLPDLIGRDGAVLWATRIRRDFLHRASQEPLEAGLSDDDAFQPNVLCPARRITAARWWIDNRDVPLRDLPEILADPGPSATAGPPPEKPGDDTTATPPATGWASFFDKKAASS